MQSVPLASTEVEVRPSQSVSLDATSSLPEEQAQESGVASEKMNVLILEDDELQRDLLSRHLESMNIQVWAVATVAAAQQALAERRYRLAIFDIHVADGNGLDLCEYIDGQPHLCGLPIIILSSHPQADVVRRCRAVGACFFLSKPYDPNVLLALVEKALGIEL